MKAVRALYRPVRLLANNQQVKSFCFLGLFILFFSLFSVPMGLANMLNTMMNTAFDLLLNTTFYIMAIAVLAGAISAVLTEFGVVDLLNRLLSPLMKPLFGLPGAAALGVVTTFLSDNPAVLSLADDKEFRRFFKAYQIPALTNLGTSFGMGMIVVTFVLGLGNTIDGNVGLAALCGSIGSFVGGIISTRMMLHTTAKVMGKDAPAVVETDTTEQAVAVADGNSSMRLLDALMTGGRTGVELGLAVIPGVLVICTIVMMLTNGVGESGQYTGAAYEGIALLPAIANRLNFILEPLYGFSHSSCIAVPITALGSAGAALGIIPTLIHKGQITCGDLAVFTAMCMCWSGYLSTHISMMDVLQCKEFAGRSILYHALGGAVAGVVAHWLFVLLSLLF